MEHPYGKQYGQEGNPRAYMTMRDYRNLPYQWGIQQPVGKNPNPPRSMREYRDQWMTGPVYHVPSTYPPPPQYDYPEPPFYTSPPQSPQSPQPLQSINPLEQAMLDLNRIMDDYVEANKKIRAHSIVTVEDNLNKKIDGLKDDFEPKWDNLHDSSEDLIDQQECPPEEVCQSDIMAEEQRIVTVQANQETETVESSLNNESDGFQIKNQESISKLAQQPDQEEENLEEESQEEECLTETVLVEQAQLQPQEELKMESVETPEELQDAPVTFWPWTNEEQISALISEEESQEEECLDGTIVEEQCEQQPHQELIEDSIELSEGLTESSDMCDVVFPRENQEEIISLLTDEAVEEHKENIFPLPPTDSVYILPLLAPQSQPKTPLPVAPSDNQVYILPTPAENPKPATPAPKAKSNPLHAMQNIKRLVASVHTFATTSNKMVNAYIAWHSGWFGCGFGFGAPGPRHF